MVLGKFQSSRGIGWAGEEDTVCLVDQSRRYAASAAERWPAAQLSEEKGAAEANPNSVREQRVYGLRPRVADLERDLG